MLKDDSGLIAGKTCTKCGVFKSLDEYFNNKSCKKDGKETRCKVCRKIELREYRINNPEKEKLRAKKYREKNADKIREYQNQWLKDNPDKAKDKQERTVAKNKDRIKARAKVKKSEKALFAKWDKYLSFADETREADEGFLEVKCTYCGKWIIPSNIEAQNRAGALNGWGQRGECKIYCGDLCKKACPSYRQVLTYKGQKEKGSSREIVPELRIMTLERDSYTCQYCGATSDCAEMHVHHIKAAIEAPMEAADLDNVITLCKKCHRAVHKKVGCKYAQLRCENKNYEKAYKWVSAEDKDIYEGKKFGSLTVLARVYDKEKRRRYSCVCECGTIKNYDIQKLKRGHTSSCGCLKKVTVNVGDVFGQLVVVRVCTEEEKPRSGSFYLCRCDCGNLSIKHATDLKTQRVKSCGKKECKKKFSLK